MLPREGGREGGRERKNMGKKEVCFPERERKRESTPTKKRKGARMRRQSKREIVCFLRITYSKKLATTGLEPSTLGRKRSFITVMLNGDAESAKLENLYSF